MIRIVFVEDDSVVMSNMRRSLSVMRRDWDMKFYSSGEDALIGIAERPFDVLVADYSMPGMNGAELLALVQYQYPRAIRVLMAGPDEAHLALASVPVAHRIVAKPCDPAELAAEIQRVCDVEQRLSDPDLQSMISEVGSLPSPSNSVVELNDLLARSDASFDEIVAVIENNAAMTAKLLATVNSAYFSLRTHVTGVHEAVSYLGFDAVRNLCVAMEIMKTFEDAPVLVQSSIDEIHERSVAVAHVARELAPDRLRASEAYVAALLHDVGLMLLASRMPEKFLELRVQSMHTALSMVEVEMEVFGAHHADIGATLLDLWGLPFEIVEAVARHHDAFNVPAERMDALHALAIADAIVSSQEAGEDAWESDALDSEYLAGLGVDQDTLQRLTVPAA